MAMQDDEDESSGWQLTESDPGVFTELLKTLQVPLIVDDLYSLDSDSLADLQPIHALIFLFKWVAGTDESGGASGVYDFDFEGFFAQQVVQNACATLAVLNGVCNIPSLSMGTELSDLISFTTGMDPQTRGLAVTSSDFLRTAHNALSPPSAMDMGGLLARPKKPQDAYHFIVYIPYKGHVYELDGLKAAPIKHAAFTGEWVETARETIQKRIATYPPGALEFNLQALRTDPLPGWRSRPQTLELASKIAIEEDKRRRWAFENSLRRHNHMGLIHALLLALAKSGGLDQAVEGAKEKMKVRIQKAKEGKTSEDMDE